MSDSQNVRRWNGGAFVVGLLGLLVFVTYLGYVVHNQYYLTGPVWLFPVGLFLMALLSGGLMYGGYWLGRSDFRDETVWRVTIWCFAGLSGSLSLTFWPMFYQYAVGIPVRDPSFVLVVSAGLGANAGVIIGIYDMSTRRRNQQLERSRETLQFVNRLLRHNVLNATQVIGGYAELLRDRHEQQSGVSPDSALRTIQQESDRITDLVQNVRVLVKQTAEGPHRTRVGLTQLVRDELEQIRDVYDHAVVDQSLRDDVVVEADELLAAALRNVVENAIEHCDRDPPRVEVTLETRDDVAVLQVADNGPGIPYGEIDAFDPGEHGDSGLGLYLAETIVADYGGSIELAENDPRGALVTIELPLARSTPAGRPAR